MGMFPQGSHGPLIINDWDAHWSLSAPPVDGSPASRVLVAMCAARLGSGTLFSGDSRWLRQGTDLEPRWVQTRTFRAESGALLLEDGSVVRGRAACMVMDAALRQDCSARPVSTSGWLVACDAALAFDAAFEADLDAQEEALAMGSESFASFERAAFVRRQARLRLSEAELVFTRALAEAVSPAAPIRVPVLL